MTCTSTSSASTPLTKQQQLDWNVISYNMIDKKIDSDRYQLIEELGRGSYGCLFLGQQMDNNDYVAIKILSKQGLNSTQLKFQQLEIDLQSQLRHNNILSLHHVVHESDYIFMIMELCDGGDLFEYVISAASEEEEQDEDELKNIFTQILDAVDYMHSQSVYHRDIKLENILLTTSKKDQQVICKVADFGLATNTRWSVEFGCGSTTYLAPEHFGTEESETGEEEEEEQEEEEEEKEDKPYDAAAGDIWSLGILLLALLFGRNPWQEATIMDPSFAEFISSPNCLKYDLFPSLSNEVLFLLKRVLTIDPTRRLTISQFKHQFKSINKLYYQGDSIQDDEEEVEEEASPMDILPISTNKSTKASYDSAIFSCHDSSTISGYSWSDMVEEDLLEIQQQQQQQKIGGSKLKQQIVEDEDIYFDHHPEEEDHDDIFIHVQEKESWWL